MLARYALADLWRNPRRTLSTMLGVSLGVGLFCGVLFFADGLSASMTQQALAPLSLDMQRIVTERAASTLKLTRTTPGATRLSAGQQAEVVLELLNDASLPAHEVTVRSLPGLGLRYVPGSARLDGAPLIGFVDNPLASGAGQMGYNLGTFDPGTAHVLSYRVEALVDGPLDDATLPTTYSTRESVRPIPANQPPPTGLATLAAAITNLPGVAHASPLSIADLGSRTLSAGTTVAVGPAKIFGFDAEYADRDASVRLVEGSFDPEGAVLSAEAARDLRLKLGDEVTIALPDGSELSLTVTGIADLSRSRSLFSSRRGGDLETFIYARNSVVVSSQVFSSQVFPAYERAIVSGAGRLKSPPIREIDITLDRELLNADPGTALVETTALAADVMAVAKGQDYLLDNISNTLTVATGDAMVAKLLFLFLGVPGGLLAAFLASYAGHVLAGAQRREQAILRIRGASKRDLLRMLALHTALLTGVGALIGLATGYAVAVSVLGRDALERASSGSLLVSALAGTVGGFAATGLALYLTSRRSIDLEINDDRARLRDRTPLWRRLHLDAAVGGLLAVATVVAVQSGAFDGVAGSVYFGRSVELNLWLLVLPLAAWTAGSLVVARVVVGTLLRLSPASSPRLPHPAWALVRRSVGRRPWAIGTAAIMVTLIVGLAVSLGAFTASYDSAKVADARYATGADVKITPSPTTGRRYTVDDAGLFRTPSILAATPVVYALSNVIVRSDRTSDPANLAAVDPATFALVAPIGSEEARALTALESHSQAVLLSRDMADFLKTDPGQDLNVLLARATPQQVEVTLRIVGVYDRLPGFPDGVDAVMAIADHTAAVPSKAPDFFLASTGAGADALRDAVAELRAGPGATGSLQIDTRASTLDRDQSSLAALNIDGLVRLNSGFALAMATAAIGIFVFGLLLQRRREYVTLRAQGLELRAVRFVIVAEAAVVAAVGVVAGVLIGAVMGLYLVMVLRPLFVLTPVFVLPVPAVALPATLVIAATALSAFLGSRHVNSLHPTELLRDD